MSPEEGIKQKKIDYCKIEDNALTLKRNHNYFYQVQGQLHITRRNYCYFVVWSPKGLLYEKIEKDDSIWQKIEPMLENFYHLAFYQK